jgi:hypothetical protein
MNVVLGGALVLCLAASAAFACDEHKKASASATTKAETKTEMVSMNGSCGTKTSMVSIFKEAPGTKTKFQKVDNGVALVVTASEDKYVPVVQTALLEHVDEMQTMAGMKAAHCATEKASVQKVSSGSSCAYKGEKASATASAEKVSSGAGCCASKASSASMQATKVSAEGCPDWMKVLCGADMQVTKTSNGVMITWTSDSKEKVNELQAAGEKFHADLAQL